VGESQDARGNAEGVKTDRHNIRVLNLGAFTKLDCASDVMKERNAALA
jgi:hypothetical protein